VRGLFWGLLWGFVLGGLFWGLDLGFGDGSFHLYEELEVLRGHPQLHRAANGVSTPIVTCLGLECGASF